MTNTSPNSRPLPSPINPSNSPASPPANAAGNSPASSPAQSPQRTPPSPTPPSPAAAPPRPPKPLILDPDDVFGTPITSAEATELALSPAQFVAIDLMLGGSTMVAAAKTAGVTRKTLYRWLHHDPKFQAAYNAWQLDALTSARSRLLAMTDDAVNTMSARVKTDGRLAFSLLKSLGTLDRPTPGSTDPEEIEQQMEIDRRKKQNSLSDEALLAALGGLG